MTSRWVNPINNNILRDKENNVLASGSVEFYAAGTSSPLAVYSDSALTTSLGSTLTADAFGLIPDFHMAAGTEYKMIGKDSGGTTKWTRDEVFSADSAVDTRLDTIESTITSLTGLTQNGCLNGGMRVGLGSDATLTTSFLEGKVDKLYGKVANVTAGTLTQAKSADYKSGYYALFSGVSMSGSGDLVAQIRIPSQEAARFVDSSATFSCVVNQDTGSNIDYTITIKKPASTADDFSSLSTVGTDSAQSVATGTDTTLEYSVADMGDVSKGIAIEISATMTGAITTKNFRFTEAQLEAAAARTQFAEQDFEVARSAIQTTRGSLGTSQLTGLTISTGTDADHDIDIATGWCYDSALASTISLTSALTKQIDANWAEGSAAGGFPSGLTLSANTWYAFFLIAKTDGTVDAGFDTSLTATNLLSDATGYTLYRRIGWVGTDAAGNIWPFAQYGDLFLHTDPFTYSWTPSTSSQTETVLAPPSSPVTVRMSASCSGTSGTRYLYIRDPSWTNTVPSSTKHSMILTTDGAGSVTENTVTVTVGTNASSQIAHRMDSTSNVTAQGIVTESWIDTRDA